FAGFEWANPLTTLTISHCHSTLYNGYHLSTAFSLNAEVNVSSLLSHHFQLSYRYSAWPGLVGPPSPVPPSSSYFSRAYSDLIAFVKDGQLDFCFYSIATDPFLIGSLEIVKINPLSYNSAGTGDSYILVNYGRLYPVSPQLVPGFTSDPDPFGRSWQSDSDFRTVDSKSARVITSKEKITINKQTPNYFPMKLYQLAVTTDSGLEYELAVDAKLDYLVCFHFAEIDSTVKKAGERVFDELVSEKNVSKVDTYKEVVAEKNLSSSVLNVKLLPVVGAPLIGLENYAMVSADLSTVPEQGDLIITYWKSKYQKNFILLVCMVEPLMLAAKRNMYQRQKSLMLLEMERQHAKGLPSLPLNPH
ncbi:uncharacterized protein LOC111282711, partial [Durio zibethinus]|uniref:Uncharacterized protein LOC111282711 n=1 Tax=Durio zibethinus TaxID=66656 RepID=A0A6P5XEG4_DURZI